jgi:hypothetical protein
MKTKLKIGTKTRPMHIEDETGTLVTIHTANLSAAQTKVLKDHLRLVAAAFTQITRYEAKQ